MVKHNILQDRQKKIENWNTGWNFLALNWFESYLKDRDYFVSMGNYTSEWTMTEFAEFPKAPFWGLFCSTSTFSHYLRLYHIMIILYINILKL